MQSTSLLALTLGDPAGIGPEVCLRALAEPEVRGAARLVLLGPAELRPAEVPLARLEDAASWRGELADGAALWVVTEGPGEFTPGRVQACCGRAALAALRVGHELAHAGHVDALVTAPVSKEALHLAGEPVEGQTELLGRWCGVDDHQMLAIAGELRVLLLTRHMPLREAIDQVSEERVVRHLRMLGAGLEELGFASPRLALAGLNPHAGEDGLLGAEDGEVLAPAVARARELGLDVTGPVSPDAVFAAAAKGEYDGVLALYHDQAFIPIKLLGEGCGFTVLLGLPYLRISPAHGTAFELVGTGRARHSDLVHALLEAARMSAAQRALRARG